MKKALVLFFLLILFLIGKTQIDNIQIGYQEFPTTITGHAADNGGNMYYSGDFKGQLKVNDQVLQTGEGLEDIFLVKKDAAGKTIFSKSFGSKNEDLTVSDALSYYNNNLYFAAIISDAISFQSFSVVPYTGTFVNQHTNCIVSFDTSGNVKWVNKTSVNISKVYASNNIIHAIGLASSGPIRYNNIVTGYNYGSQTIVHFMFDAAGNLINYKSITPKSSAQSFQMPVYLNSYSNGDICMLISIYGDSSFQIGKKTIALPGVTNNYYVLIKTDTSYTNVSYKILNPAGLSFTSDLALHLSKQDSVYFILAADNPSVEVEYDGLKVPVYNNNVLVVLDPFFKAARVVNLGSSYVGDDFGKPSKRRILFRTINTANNNIFFSGTYVGANEAPFNQIPVKDTNIVIIPNLNAAVDLNGPSKSFIANTSLGFSNGSLIWLGNHSQYETPYLYFSFCHTVNDSLLVFSINPDNVWNPRIINTKTNTVSGSMIPGADLPDIIQFVEYLADGSRIILGFARGKTALDSSAVGIKSNMNRTDAFIARITSKGEVKWYKRLSSTLRGASPVKLIIKDNKAYFLINYLGSVNENDYIQVNKKTYSAQPFQSLLASIDSLGNIDVINLENNNIKDSYIIDFDFCPNGDIALLTNFTAPNPYSTFPSSPGVFIYRLNPFSKTLISARKLIADNIYAFVPAHIQVDSNDLMYLSVPLNFSTGPQYKYEKLLLHNGNNYIDTAIYENNVFGVDYGGLGILKMTWDKFNWYKRSSGSNSFSSGRFPYAFAVNKKIVFIGESGSAYGSFYWDKKLIMPDMIPSASYFFQMDTSGEIQQYKSVSDYFIQFAKKRTNGSIFISGYNNKPTSVDTISVGNSGLDDALSFTIDSSFKTTKSFRLATPYFEFMSDIDVFQDSLVSFAYTAQTPPFLYANRPVVLASDYDANAFLGSTVITNQIVLPLKLISFNAIRKDNVVNLDWTIVSNEEGVKYIVQRSLNESVFKNIDTKNSIDSSSAVIYRTADNLNDYGKYYYRLQIISKDGKTSYSKIAQVIYPPKQSAFYYDNSSHQLHVLRTDAAAYQWKIFDASGKTILTGQKTTGNKLIDLSNQPKGQYIVRTLDDNFTNQTYKFIK